jgi:hypothetical protein
MRTETVQRVVLVYAGALTAAVCVALLSGFVGVPAKHRQIDELDVQRINLLEADGTLRMVIANKSRFPGFIAKGKEFAHDRDTAGVLFFNEEGTENGGLIWSGHRDADGKVAHSGLSLTFDKYENDQLVKIEGSEDKDTRWAGMTVYDRPDRSIVEAFEERATLAAMPEAQRTALLRKRSESGYYGTQRLVAGRGDDNASSVLLKDAAGKTRLKLRVDAGGQARIQFLDADGKLTGDIGPDGKAAPAS